MNPLTLLEAPPSSKSPDTRKPTARDEAERPFGEVLRDASTDAETGDADSITPTDASQRTGSDAAGEATRFSSKHELVASGEETDAGGAPGEATLGDATLGDAEAASTDGATAPTIDASAADPTSSAPLTAAIQAATANADAADPQSDTEDALEGLSEHDELAANEAGLGAFAAPSSTMGADSRASSGGSSNTSNGIVELAKAARVSTATAADTSTSFEAALEMAVASGADADEAQQIRAATASAPTPSAATAAPVSTQLATAIIAKPADNRIEMRLDPAELGRVTIELSFENDEVNVVLRAEEKDALDLMRRHADDLREQLKEQGLTLGSMSFESFAGTGDDQNNPDGRGTAEGADTLSALPLTADLATAAAPLKIGSGGLDIRL